MRYIISFYVLLNVTLSFFVYVPVNDIAVATNIFTGNHTSIAEGLHTRNPFSKITEYNKHTTVLFK